MCACAFYQREDHWMYLLPRRSTRLVTEEHKIIFLSRSWMIIITNITIFCPDEIQSPNSKFHSTTNLLEGERKKEPGVQECIVRRRSRTGSLFRVLEGIAGGAWSWQCRELAVAVRCPALGRALLPGLIRQGSSNGSRITPPWVPSWVDQTKAPAALYRGVPHPERWAGGSTKGLGRRGEEQSPSADFSY